MTTSKLLAAALIVSAASLVPTLSEARSHHHRHYGAHSFNGLPYAISYVHNYGPGPLPESFAYYDGPSTNHCYRSSAAYLGQDGDRHPCF
jgi:hypothetical protein